MKGRLLKIIASLGSLVAMIMAGSASLKIG
jgi:hypothetical protein